MLEKIETIDAVTVLKSGQLEIKKATIVLDDGVELSCTYHRYVVEPGDDLEIEDDFVKNIGNAVHTPELITAFRDARLL